MTFRHLMHRSRAFLDLCKATISVFAALSAATGFLVAARTAGTSLVLVVTGVFLMACGAGALNHYQEQDIDARMARTSGRPLPTGKVRPAHALCFSLLLICAGLVALLVTRTATAPLLGLAAVFWYNGFYTKLKTSTAFASIPGALIGAIPPAIGWAAGGGNLFDPQLAALCLFFFLWQIPHFFLHHLIFGRQYDSIGLPSMTAVFTVDQINRLTCHWLFAAAASLQFLVILGLLHHLPVQIALLVSSLWLTATGIRLLRVSHPNYANAFRGTNIYVFTAMVIMILDTFPDLFR